MRKVRENKVFIVLFLLFSVLFFLRCSEPTGPNPPEEKKEISKGIIPLKAGYYWEYKNYYLREDSSIAGEGIGEKYVINNSSSYEFENRNYVLFHRIRGYFDPEIQEYRFGDDEWFFRNFDDGLYSMGGKILSDSIYTNLLLYKYPVNKGESWESPHLVYDLRVNRYLIPDSVNYMCTDTNAVFETPLGNFSCIVYNHQEDQDEDVNAKLNIYEYYTVNVGLVGVIYKGYFDNPDSSYFKSKKVLVQTNVQH